MQILPADKTTKSKQAEYACKGCSDPRWGKVVNLCIKECFEKFHTHYVWKQMRNPIELSKNAKRDKTKDKHIFGIFS